VVVDTGTVVEMGCTVVVVVVVDVVDMLLEASVAG
jgi:hypothetical protein